MRVAGYGRRGIGHAEQPVGAGSRHGCNLERGRGVLRADQERPKVGRLDPRYGLVKKDGHGRVVDYDGGPDGRALRVGHGGGGRPVERRARPQVGQAPHL